MNIISLKSGTALVATGLLAACAAPNIPKMITETQQSQDYEPVTMVDEAIECAGEWIVANGNPMIGVASFPDKTGQLSQSEGGNGAYVSQGGEQYTLAALDTAGVRYRNLNEWAWLKSATGSTDMYAEKVVDSAKLNGVDLMFSGATTSVSFIPGGGLSLYFNGKGADVRTYAATVHKIGSLSKVGFDSKTGKYEWETIGTVQARKSQVAHEFNLGVFAFFGDDYVEGSGGFTKRGALAITDEATHKLLTFRALGELLPAEKFAECDALVPPTPVVDENGNAIYKERDGSIRVIAMDGTVTNYDADGKKVLDTGDETAKMDATIDGGVGESS